MTGNGPGGPDAPGDPATAAACDLLPIGEVARQAGVTTRTLRYWEELGLVSPSGRKGSGYRLYAPAAVARVGRIRELQELLGFSLAEVRVVLDTEDVDVLDRVRSEYRRGDASPDRRRVLLDAAIAANEKLLARLDDTLDRIGAFRAERAAKAVRLRTVRDELDRPADPDRPTKRATRPTRRPRTPTSHQRST